MDYPRNRHKKGRSVRGETERPAPKRSTEGSRGELPSGGEGTDAQAHRVRMTRRFRAFCSVMLVYRMHDRYT